MVNISKENLTFFILNKNTHTKIILTTQSSLILILFSTFDRKKNHLSFQPNVEQNPNSLPPDTNTSIPMGFVQYESYMNLINSNSPYCNFLHPLTCSKTQIFNKTFSVLSLPCNKQPQNHHPHNHHKKFFLKHK